MLVISRGVVGALGLGPKLVPAVDGAPRVPTHGGSPRRADAQTARQFSASQSAFSPKTSLSPPGRRHTPLSLTASAPSCLSPHFTQEVTAAQRGAATCPRSQRMSRESAWVLPGTAPSFPASGPLRCRDRASPGLDPRRSDFGVPEICRASAEPCLAPRRAPAQ